MTLHLSTGETVTVTETLPDHTSRYGFATLTDAATGASIQVNLAHVTHITR